MYKLRFRVGETIDLRLGRPQSPRRDFVYPWRDLVYVLKVENDADQFMDPKERYDKELKCVDPLHSS